MARTILNCFEDNNIRVESEIINPFTMIYTEIIEDVDTYSKNEVLAYMALCKFANNITKECFPSYKSIAKIMRTSVTLAQQGIKGLLEKGVIKYKQRLNKKNQNELDSNVYVLVDKSEWEQTKITNGKVLAEREMLYKTKNEKIKEAKKGNKKVASPPQTNNSKEPSKEDSSVSNVNNSISQKDVIIQEKKVKNSKKSNSNYNQGKKFKTRFHNINQTFDKYAPEELEKRLLENQKTKELERKNREKLEKTITHEELEKKSKIWDSEFTF